MTSMGDLIRYRSPRARQETTAWIGMVIFLASWVLLFGALFFAWGLLRFRAASWPPEGVEPLSVALPTLNTVLLVVSSIALQGGLWAARAGRPKLVGRLVLAAVLLADAFMAGQILVWVGTMREGFTPASAGAYSALFYGLSWFHGLHVAVGAIALSWLAYRGYQGGYTPARHLSLRLWTMYWHFVGIVWLIMFVLLFFI
jgi:cytochrome c oxidase subunit III